MWFDWLIERPEGAFTATGVPTGLNDPVPTVKNATWFEAVSATARIPSRVSISTALGKEPGGRAVVAARAGNTVE